MDEKNLLLELKDKLQITWEDEDTDRRLKNILKDSEAALNFKIGAQIDYSKSGLERSLFLNYCMYEYNNCSNLFDSNYKNDLYQLRIFYEVESYEKN